MARDALTVPGRHTRPYPCGRFAKPLGRDKTLSALVRCCQATVGQMSRPDPACRGLLDKSEFPVEVGQAVLGLGQGAEALAVPQSPIDCVRRDAVRSVSSTLRSPSRSVVLAERPLSEPWTRMSPTDVRSGPLAYAPGIRHGEVRNPVGAKVTSRDAVGAKADRRLLSGEEAVGGRRRAGCGVRGVRGAGRGGCRWQPVPTVSRRFPSLSGPINAGWDERWRGKVG